MLIHLHPQAAEPLYSQLYQAIKDQIHRGQLTAQQKLPSKRQLAKDLAVSLNTVMNAYDQLSLEGYIEARPRQGYFVADVRYQSQLAAAKTEQPLDTAPRWRWDLTKAAADVQLFPFQTFRKLYQRRFDSADPQLLAASPVQGLADLRTSLAHYLQQERGVPCQADQLILGPNAQSLYQILAQLLPANQRIGIEDPGYHAQLPYLRRIGWAIVPCPLDRRGLQLDPAQLDQLDVVCVTPTHQFPTGSVMPLARRQALLDWAGEASDRWVIEDDYDSQYKYSGRPIPSLAQLDGLEQVIYMGSLSRILSPGLRVSYMVLPPRLLDRFHQMASQFGANLNTISQYAIHDFIQDGHLARHLNRARSYYKRKRDRLIKAIQAQDPAAQLIGLDAGLHLLVQPSQPFDWPSASARLAQQGLRLKTLADFSLQPAAGADQVLFVSFSALPLDQVEEVAAILFQALSEARHPASH